MKRYKGHVCEELKVESIFNNTNEYIICGSENGFINIYDLVSVFRLKLNFKQTKPVYTLSYHTQPVTSIRQHPDKKQLLAACYDGVVSVWEQIVLFDVC